MVRRKVVKQMAVGSATNLSPNVAAAACYVPLVGWVPAVVLLLIEKNPAVKWHAVQALLLTGLIWVTVLVLGATLVLALLTPLVWVAGLVVQLVLAVKSYQGEKARLPGLAGWADKLVKKGNL